MKAEVEEGVTEFEYPEMAAAGSRKGSQSGRPNDLSEAELSARFRDLFPVAAPPLNGARQGSRQGSRQGARQGSRSDTTNGMGQQWSRDLDLGEDDREGQDGTDLDSAGLDSAGLDRTGLDRTGLDRTGLDRTGLDRTDEELMPWEAIALPGNAKPRNPYFDQADGEPRDVNRRGSAAASTEAEFASSMARQFRLGEESGRSEGFALGLNSGRAEMTEALTFEKSRAQQLAARLAEEFAEERTAYFELAERETVLLSLAIAERILRREAEADPLLLTNAVRVALGQLAQSTRINLWVPGPDQLMWQQGMALIPGLRARLEILADSEMATGDCRIETELGSVDLSISGQLKRIEQGLI